MKTKKIAVIILIGSLIMNLMACNSTNSKKNTEETEKTQSTIENIQSLNRQLNNELTKTNNKKETAQVSENASKETEQDDSKSENSENKVVKDTCEKSISMDSNNNSQQSTSSLQQDSNTISNPNTNTTNISIGASADATSSTTSISTSSQIVEPEYYPEPKVSKSVSSYVNSAGNNVDVLDIYHEYGPKIWARSHSETEIIDEADGTTSYITTITNEDYDGNTNTHNKKTSQSVMSHVGTPSSDKQPDVGPIEVEKGDTFGS